MLYGAIIGDIVGSRFEFNNYRSEDFEFFHPDCKLTDDSLMTIAVAESIACYPKGLENGLEDDVIKRMRRIGRRRPDVSWGGRFREWLYSDDPKPYNSFGNGAAMRVSACGWIDGSIRDAVELSERVTVVTHNHPEGVKGARAVTAAIYMAKYAHSKDAIGKMAAKIYPILNDPDFSVECIREINVFDETCQGTVPQAIQVFLESQNFEDAIRKAVSIGGDSDTIAAIVGSIAEAYYGIPYWMIRTADAYLEGAGLLETVRILEARIQDRH